MIKAVSIENVRHFEHNPMQRFKSNKYFLILKLKINEKPYTTKTYIVHNVSHGNKIKKDECVVHIIFFVEPEHNTLGYS